MANPVSSDRTGPQFATPPLDEETVDTDKYLASVFRGPGTAANAALTNFKNIYNWQCPVGAHPHIHATVKAAYICSQVFSTLVPLCPECKKTEAPSEGMVSHDDDLSRIWHHVLNLPLAPQFVPNKGDQRILYWWNCSSNGNHPPYTRTLQQMKGYINFENSSRGCPECMAERKEGKKNLKRYGSAARKGRAVASPAAPSSAAQRASDIDLNLPRSVSQNEAAAPIAHEPQDSDIDLLRYLLNLPPLPGSVPPIEAQSGFANFQAQSAAAPGRVASSAAPVRAPSTASPGRAASAAAPDRAPSTASPGRAASSAAPDRAPSTASPGRAASSAAPDRAASSGYLKGLDQQFIGLCDPNSYDFFLANPMDWATAYKIPNRALVGAIYQQCARYPELWAIAFDQEIMWRGKDGKRCKGTPNDFYDKNGTDLVPSAALQNKSRVEMVEMCKATYHNWRRLAKQAAKLLIYLDFTSDPENWAKRHGIKNLAFVRYFRSQCMHDALSWAIFFDQEVKYFPLGSHQLADIKPSDLWDCIWTELERKRQTAEQKTNSVTGDGEPPTKRPRVV